MKRCTFRQLGKCLHWNHEYSGDERKNPIGQVQQASWPELSEGLLAIKCRLVDLHPITRRNYYHPNQHGSWSIKKVLPAVAPDLSYAALNGVQDGGMAMETYLEAINPDTTQERKDEIERQLEDYCGLDTFAMIRLWQYLRNSTRH